MGRKIFLLILTFVIGMVVGPVDLHAAPISNAAAARSESGYVSQTFTVRNIEFAALLSELRRWQFNIPVHGQGKVTASVTVHVPWRHPLTWGDYRFDAKLNSQQLELEGLEFRRATAALSYAQGRLQIDSAQFTVVDPQTHTDAGTFTGAAGLQVVPLGDLTTKLQVDDFLLAALRPLRIDMPGLTGGRVYGTLRTQVAFDRIRDLAAWDASGDVTLGDLKFQELPPLDGKSRFQFKQGSLMLESLNVHLGDASLTATGHLSSRAPYPYQLDVRDLTTDLQDWHGLLPAWAAHHQIRGKLHADTIVSGDLSPLSWTATGTVQMPHMALDSLQIDNSRAQYSVDTSQVLINRAQASLYGGTTELTGMIPLSTKNAGRLALRWNNLALGQLVADATKLSIDGGTSAGRIDITIPADKLQDVAAWQATGAATIDDLAVNGVDIRTARASLDVRDQSLVVAPLQVTLRRGGIAAAVRGNLKTGQVAVNYVAQDIRLADFENVLPEFARPVSGLASLNGSILADLTQLSFTAAGTCRFREVAWRGLRLAAGQFGFAASQYGVRVADLSAQAYGGTLAASGTLPFDARVAGAVDAQWQDIDGGAIAADLDWLPRGLIARLRGSVHLKLPPGKNRDVASLQGNARLDAANIAGWGLRNGRLAAQATLQDGILRVPALELDWPDGRLRSAGQLALTDCFQFAAKLQAAGSLPRSVLQGAAPVATPVSGQFDMKAQVHGTVHPLSVNGAGGGTIKDMRVGNVGINGAVFDFLADGPTLRVKRFNAGLYGGQLQGQATISLTDDQASEAHIKATAIDAGRLIRDAVRLSFSIEAPLTAALDIEMPAGKLQDVDQWDVVATGSAPEVRLNHQLAGNMSAEAAYRGGVFSGQASGDLLGAKLNMLAAWGNAEAKRPGSGSVELRGLELSRLAPLVANNRPFQELSGRFDLVLPFTIPAPFGLPTGEGNYRFRDVAWNRTVLARQVSGRVKLERAGLLLVDAGGDLAQGILRADAAMDFRNPADRRFEVSLSGARAEELLLPWPALNGVATGRVDLRLRGSLAWITRIDGTLTMTGGRSYGLDLNDLRLPFSGAVDMAGQQLDLRVTEGAGDIAHGRVQIQGAVRWAYSLAVELGLQFTELDLQPLLSAAGNLGPVQAGRASGTMKVNGQDVHSLNDLSGTIQARMRNIQPAGLPVFTQISPYLTGGLGGPGFTDGNLRARLGGGVVSIQQLAMTGPAVQLYATGNVTLAGALDLDVFASNYTSPAGVLGPALLARLPLAATGPVGVLISISQLLSNRVIYLDVTGTARAPILHLRPLPTLTNEAARFFLGGSY